MHYYIYILFLFSPLCTFLQVSVSSRANLLKKIKKEISNILSTECEHFNEDSLTNFCYLYQKVYFI